PRAPLFPYTTLFRSADAAFEHAHPQCSFSPGHVGAGRFHDDVFDVRPLCGHGVENRGVAELGGLEFGRLGQSHDRVRVAGGHAQSGSGHFDAAGGHEHRTRRVERPVAPPRPMTVSGLPVNSRTPDRAISKAPVATSTDSAGPTAQPPMSFVSRASVDARAPYVPASRLSSPVCPPGAGLRVVLTV